jgi:hypothetical protein
MSGGSCIQTWQYTRGVVMEKRKVKGTAAATGLVT